MLIKSKKKFSKRLMHKTEHDGYLSSAFYRQNDYRPVVIAIDVDDRLVYIEMTIDEFKSINKSLKNIIEAS